MPNRKMVEKISRYEFILKLKKQGVFVDLIASGLMSVSVAGWFDIYELYLKYKNAKEVADILDNKISDRHVYRIIKFMEN